MIPINDLSRGIAQSHEAAEAISRVLKSGFWIHGPEHAAFEREFAEYLNIDHVLGVASGTDALEIALRAVGCKRGSKVVSVANAGGYTAIAAARIGCEVIFCDVNSETLLLDPEALVPLLSKEISAVVVTHLYGNVAPVSMVKSMCDQLGIYVIEDCAQATGASEDGIRVGAIGHIGTFSFYPTKNLGAIGDGGALSTKDSEIAQRITELRQYGWSTKYKIDLPGGMNSRLDEIQAAVLRVSLPSLNSMTERRISIIEKYAISLQDSALRLITSFQTGNVAHLAVVEAPDSMGRNRLIQHMKEHGIQTGIHYPILDSNQLGLPDMAQTATLPNSISSVDRIVSIPLFPELSDNEIGAICDALRSFL